MNNKVETNVLYKASECFQEARRNIIEGARWLYEIDTYERWKGKYGSFGEYLDQECQISRSFAAKLIKVWSFYIVENNLTSIQLHEVDSEKLYLAVSLRGFTPDEKLLRAQTWTRQEIKAELAEKNGEPCKHDCEHITLCSHCHARL